ncbi:unnamed protein product [Notodromas monacha]|uniref:Uncharacterized protein n=1 Tax=Notodromas monacha TaxID=399045 RepID=A0A7R9C369_9CRUS|nr:unnamed protein product [Notodromas monacha]CAG0925342.1 unnamed protein product [Notodromas monacha]
MWEEIPRSSFMNIFDNRRMMLPYDCVTGPLDPHHQAKPPRHFLLHIPRVIPDQKARFEGDDIFKKLSREAEVRFLMSTCSNHRVSNWKMYILVQVRYTGYRDRPMEERRARFQNGVRDGHTELAFLGSGINFQLIFTPAANGFTGPHHQPHAPHMHGLPPDFDSEPGKVHINASIIMNGVCVRWRGWVDLERLDGAGCLEFDEQNAEVLIEILKSAIFHEKFTLTKSYCV